MEEEKKVCKKCDKEKLLSEFKKAKSTRDGLEGSCKKCRAIADSKRAEQRRTSPKIYVEEKKCTQCNFIKNRTEFCKCATASDGLYSSCRLCNKKRNEKYKYNGEIVISEKKCSSCTLVKNTNEFSPNTSSKDGLRGQCKDCRSKKEGLRREKIRHSEKIVIIEKQCAKCTKTKMAKEFVKTPITIDGLASRCKDCHNKAMKKDRIKNPDKHKEINDRYRQNNLEEVRKREAAKHKKNRHLPKYKKRHAWRAILRSTLVRMGTEKQGRTRDILGYSAEELYEHLQSQMAPGKDFIVEYGINGQTIDHVISVACFKLDTPQNIVNALPNLRPLYCKENSGRSQVIDWLDPDVQSVLEQVPELVFYIKDEYLSNCDDDEYENLEEAA